MPAVGDDPVDLLGDLQRLVHVASLSGNDDDGALAARVGPAGSGGGEDARRGRGRGDAEAPGQVPAGGRGRGLVRSDHLDVP